MARLKRPTVVSKKLAPASPHSRPDLEPESHRRSKKIRLGRVGSVAEQELAADGSIQESIQAVVAGNQTLQPTAANGHSHQVVTTKRTALLESVAEAASEVEFVVPTPLLPKDLKRPPVLETNLPKFMNGHRAASNGAQGRNAQSGQSQLRSATGAGSPLARHRNPPIFINNRQPSIYDIVYDEIDVVYTPPADDLQEGMFIDLEAVVNDKVDGPRRGEASSAVGLSPDDRRDPPDDNREECINGHAGDEEDEDMFVDQFAILEDPAQAVQVQEATGEATRDSPENEDTPGAEPETGPRNMQGDEQDEVPSAAQREHTNRRRGNGTTCDKDLSVPPISLEFGPEDLEDEHFAVVNISSAAQAAGPMGAAEWANKGKNWAAGLLSDLQISKVKTRSFSTGRLLKHLESLLSDLDQIPSAEDLVEQGTHLRDQASLLGLRLSEVHKSVAEICQLRLRRVGGELISDKEGKQRHSVREDLVSIVFPVAVIVLRRACSLGGTSRSEGRFSMPTLTILSSLVGWLRDLWDVLGLELVRMDRLGQAAGGLMPRKARSKSKKEVDAEMRRRATLQASFDHLSEEVEKARSVLDGHEERTLQARRWGEEENRRALERDAAAERARERRRQAEDELARETFERFCRSTHSMSTNPLDEHRRRMMMQRDPVWLYTQAAVLPSSQDQQEVLLKQRQLQQQASMVVEDELDFNDGFGDDYGDEDYGYDDPLDDDVDDPLDEDNDDYDEGWTPTDADKTFVMDQLLRTDQRFDPARVAARLKCSVADILWCKERLQDSAMKAYGRDPRYASKPLPAWVSK